MKDFLHSLVMPVFWMSKKSDSFPHGLVWHMHSHSNWNKINYRVFFQIFYGRKPIFSKEILYVSLQFISHAQNHREGTLGCSHYNAFAIW